MWGKIIFLKKQITYLKLFKRKTKKMKKSKVITSFVCVLCSLFSCSSDDIENISNNSGNEEIIKVAYIDDNGNITNSGEVKNQVLCFASEAKYNEFVNNLKNLSNENKENTFKELGFTNLKEIVKIADAELDSIGETSNSETEFRNKYNSYVSKYANVLTTNKYDSLDLSLYVPTSADEEVDPYIVGASKTIVINGNARKINFHNDMNSKDKKMYGTKDNVQVLSPEINGNDNTLITRSDDRLPWSIPYMPWNIKGEGKNGINSPWLDCGIKVIFSCNVIRIAPAAGIVEFHFGAQKKMWYGSKRTNREIYFMPINISGFNINTGTQTTSNKNSYIIKANNNSDLYGLTCKSCEKDRKFCNIGSEEFPVGYLNTTPGLGGVSYKISGAIVIWIMCHGEKYTYNNVTLNTREYPSVVCYLDQSGFFSYK
jgi:hypothetical protein